MIVKGLIESQDRVSDPDQIKKPLKMWTEAEVDLESGGSPEEVESPKSVAMGGRRGKVHSQVLKIREEESHLGEDIGKGLSPKDGIGDAIQGCVDYNHHYNRSGRRPALDVMILSRPILPSSPLSGKTPVKFLH